MNSFCIFCGSELKDGMCECSGFKAYYGSIAKEEQAFCIYCGNKIASGTVCPCQMGAGEVTVPTVTESIPEEKQFCIYCGNVLNSGEVCSCGMGVVGEAPAMPEATEVPYSMPEAAVAPEAPYVAPTAPVEAAPDYSAHSFGAPLPYPTVTDAMTDGSIKSSMKAKVEMDSKTVAEMQAGKKFFNKADDLD